MITNKRHHKGDYYRVCVIQLHPKVGNTSSRAIKQEFFRKASKAGKVAAAWSSDLPRPIADHYVSIQYIEAKS